MRILSLMLASTFALAPLTKRLGTPGRLVVVSSSSYDVEGGAESSAPYDIEEPPAPAAEPTKDVAALKSKLFAACAAADRGFAASPSSAIVAECGATRGSRRHGANWWRARRACVFRRYAMIFFVNQFDAPTARADATTRATRAKRWENEMGN